MTDSNKLVPTVGWQQVLRLLRLPVPSEILPLVLRCPLCKRPRLRIMRDVARNGQWHYCENCGSQGDMVSLAAAVWGLSYDETEQRLRRAGLPALVSKTHKKSYLDYLERLTQFQQVFRLGLAATKRGAGTVDAAVRVVRGRPPRIETWQAGPGQLIATLTAAQLQEFKGKGWLTSSPLKSRAAVLLPAYDLPGRACAVTVGWQDKERDRWRHVSLAGPSWGPPDAGLCFHPGFKPWQHETEVLAVPCLPAVPHLIYRHSNTFAGPAPIVGFTANDEIETTNAWHMLRRAKVYMWLPKLTAAYVRQMWRANACVFLWTMEDTMESMLEYMAKTGTYLELHRTVMTKAVPWQLALAQAAAKLPADEFDDAIVGANLPSEVYANLLAAWPEFLQTRLLAKLRAPEPAAEATAANEYCVINDKLYRVQSREKLLCDAILEVDTVVHGQQDNKIRYEGRVRHNGKQYAFTELAANIENRTLSWLRNFLLEHDAGVCTASIRGMELMSIFLQLHPPKAISAVSCIGWNQKNQRLDLPRFSLRPGGDVQRHRLVQGTAYPAETWIESQPLTPAEIQEATGPDTSQFWGLAAATIANVLRPYWQESQQAVTVSCELIPNSVWRALGCLPGAFGDRTHNWPRVILQRTSQQFAAWAASANADRNCVIPLDWWASRLVMLTCHNAIQINGDKLGTMQDTLEQVGPYLLSGYLQDLAARDFELAGSGETIPRLLGDMANWAHRQGGSADNVLLGEQEMRLPGTTTTLQTLGEIYTQLFLAKRVDLLSPVEAVKQNPAVPVIWRRKQAAALPLAALLSACRRHRTPDPLFANITDAVQSFGLPVIRDDKDTYLQVPWDWFCKFFPKKMKQLVTT